MSQPHRGFLPTRDLPRLRPPPAPEAVQTALDNLAAAVGLGQEDVKHFDLTNVILSNGVAAPDVGSTISEECTASAAQPSGTSTEEGDTDGRRRLGSVEDDIEARFAQTWLTKIVSYDEDPDLQEGAARILAALCGKPASQPTVTRFVFGGSGDASAEVRIQDSPITADALGNRTWGAAPLLARTLLADYRQLLSAPSLSSSEACVTAVSTSSFQQGHLPSASRVPRSVLELGAGTGLVGLALCAAARAWVDPTRPGGELRRPEEFEMDTTDYHPHVLANLEKNIELNGFSSESGQGSPEGTSGTRIGVAKLDWQAVHHEVTASTSASADASGVAKAPRASLPSEPNDSAYVSTAQTLPEESAEAGQRNAWPTIDPAKQYDVLIAADCIYDPFHPLWIRSVAARHLTRSFPDSNVADALPHLLHPGVLFLISPLRRTHTAEIRAIYEAFPRAAKAGEMAPASASASASATDPDSEPGLELQITREWEEVGWDDFGPRTFQFRGDTTSMADPDGSDGEARRGLKTTYRTFEIRWCSRGSGARV